MQAINNCKEANCENLSLEQTLIKVWAVQRTQTYPKVFELKPYDLAICALLDSYYPRKINYYILNLEDHEKNLQLANKVMKELGIDVLIQNDKEIDEQTLLKQLELAQKVLDPNSSLKGSKDNAEKEKKALIQLPNQKETENKLQEQIKKDKLAYAKKQSKNKNGITEEDIEKLFKENKEAYEKRREYFDNSLKNENQN